MSKESLTLVERTVFFVRIAHSLSVSARTWIIVFMIIEFLGFIPVLGIFGVLPNRRFGMDFWPLIAIIWCAFYLFVGLNLRSLHCPQCGKSYFGNYLDLLGGYEVPGRRFSLFTRECANCGSREVSN
jgi:ribosomal protein S27AE